jgi:hypothetical protein
VIHLISKYCVYIFRYNILLHAWHDTLLLVHVDLTILYRYIYKYTRTLYQALGASYNLHMHIGIHTCKHNYSSQARRSTAGSRLLS